MDLTFLSDYCVHSNLLYIRSFTDITFSTWASTFINFTGLVQRFIFNSKQGFYFFYYPFYSRIKLIFSKLVKFLINCLDELSVFIWTESCFFFQYRWERLCIVYFVFWRNGFKQAPPVLHCMRIYQLVKSSVGILNFLLLFPLANETYKYNV